MNKMKSTRDRDLNPGGARLHGISSPAPYLARLSRHLITLINLFISWDWLSLHDSCKKEI